MLLPDNLKTLRFLRLINRVGNAASSGGNPVIRTAWLNSRVHFTQESMCLVVEPWHTQTLLIAAVTLMLTVREVPGQNQKPSIRGYFDLQDLHLTDVLTVTKQKSRALCSQPVNLKYIWLHWQWHCAGAPLFLMWMLWFIQPGELSQTNEAKTCKRLAVESKF